MKFCNNCGNQVNEGDKFCNNCGTPVAVLSNDYVEAPVQNEGPTSYNQVEQGPGVAPQNQGQAQNAYNPNGSFAPNMVGYGTFPGQEPPKKSKKGLIIGLSAGLAVILAAVAAYFLFFMPKNDISGQWQATASNTTSTFDIKENNDVTYTYVYGKEGQGRFIERKWYYPLVKKDDGTYTFDNTIENTRLEGRGTDTRDIPGAFYAYPELVDALEKLGRNTTVDKMKETVKAVIKENGSPATDAEVDKIFSTMTINQDGSWTWNYSVKDLKEVVENDSSDYDGFLKEFAGRTVVIEKKNDTTLHFKYQSGSTRDFNKITK